MTPKEFDTQTPALLATMSICGMDGAQAGRVLGQCCSRFRYPEVSRARVFREVVGICQQSTTSTSGALRGPGDIDFPSDPAFEALAWDIRLAVFLIAMLDFDLTETAFILQRNVHALAQRVEHALDQLKW